MMSEYAEIAVEARRQKKNPNAVHARMVEMGIEDDEGWEGIPEMLYL